MGSNLGPGLVVSSVVPRSKIQESISEQYMPSYFQVLFHSLFTAHRHRAVVSSPKCPNRLWNQNSLLFIGYRLLYCRWHSGWCAKLTADRHIVQRLKMSAAIPPSPYAFMAFTGTILSNHSITLLRYKKKLTVKQATKGIEV